jgi:UDP-glucose 4-epimerase
MSKIVVFGGGGFLGSAVVDRLLRDGHQLRIFDRPSVAPFRKFSETEGVEWCVGDFMNEHEVGEVLGGADVAIHLVSATLPNDSNKDPIYDVNCNVIATLQLLEAMRKKDVGKIIFISSGGTVYGPPRYLPIDETHETNPIVAYGISKLAIEKYLLFYQYHYGIKSNILRLTNPYGERQPANKAQGVVAVFVRRALQGLPLQIWGDGSTVRDYIYVSDVAEAVARAIVYQGETSVFNISTGNGISVNRLIETIEDVMSQPITRQYTRARASDVSANVLENALAREELGWRPTTELVDGIRRTVRWMIDVTKSDN